MTSFIRVWWAIGRCEVLATAHSKVTGKDHPMAFVFEYGKGRVFHTPLGHDVRAHRDARRGRIDPPRVLVGGRKRNRSRCLGAGSCKKFSPAEKYFFDLGCARCIVSAGRCGPSPRVAEVVSAPAHYAVQLTRIFRRRVPLHGASQRRA